MQEAAPGQPSLTRPAPLPGSDEINSPHVVALTVQLVVTGSLEAAQRG